MTTNKIMTLAWQEAAHTPGFAYGAVITKDGEVVAHDHHHVLEIPDVSAQVSDVTIEELTKFLGLKIKITRFVSGLSF